MAFGKNSFKVVLLTVLVLSVFTIAIIELTGVSRNSFSRKNRYDREGEFTDRSGEIYHGEIYAEETRTRCDRMAKMPKTTMQFYETKYSFGSASVGRTLIHVFHYKNTGNAPLLICKADVSCGCTVPKFPDEAIPPGADGEFTVEFNTTGKSGFQQKSIIVHSNSLPEAVSIGIEADVH